MAFGRKVCSGEPRLSCEPFSWNPAHQNPFRRPREQHPAQRGGGRPQLAAAVGDDTGRGRQIHQIACPAALVASQVAVASAKRSCDKVGLKLVCAQNKITFRTRACQAALRALTRGASRRVAPTKLLNSGNMQIPASTKTCQYVICSPCFQHAACLT